jgi:sugar phosphate isomerase/epimerase
MKKLTTDRRGFLKTTTALSAAIGMGSLAATPLSAGEQVKGAPNAEKLGWRLGCQAYTFNQFTFYQAVDKTASLGLHYIEAYPGQKLSAEKPDVKFGDAMSAEVRAEVKQKLKDAGVTLVCYGVVGLAADEAASRKVFEFAKDMGIETIVSEPAPDAMALVDRLCQEFKITVAIHNHPKPSHYWNPQTVLDACKDRSRMVGSCADTGHWMRSGLDPIEAIKMLKGRIISFHFKDLNHKGEGAHDVPWGTGEGNVRGMLEEIHQQKFKGVFSIEYEHNWLNSLPEIAKCVEFFNKVAGELADKS